MTDKYAREKIHSLEQELHNIKWELKHKIWAIYEHLGVKEEIIPQQQVLVKKDKEEK